MPPLKTRVTQETADYVARHARQDEILARVARETEEMPRSRMVTTPDEGAFLTMLAKVAGATTALEVGTFTGYGAISIARGLELGGTLTCLELEQEFADVARGNLEAAGVADRVEIRVADERDTGDGPYDAVSSIGMFEHVGAARLSEYFTHLHALLRPGGRLLNHGIARTAGASRARFARRSFIDSFVFPDGELHEVGRVVTSMQEAGFEVRDLENLREHYALTLRHWVSNLERGRSEAIAHASDGRYRVWRLYMAASALNFEAGRTQVHQLLGVRMSADGASGVPLRRGDSVL
jgi:cyclopropane-fatty-acyl-phospholipid synthase